MNLGQRIVLVVALAFALAVAVYGVDLLTRPEPVGYFSSYSLDGSTATVGRYAIDKSSVLRIAAGWLAAIAVWTAAAMYLLRNRQ